MIIKARYHRVPGAPHVTCDVFVGPELGRLQLAGSLRFGIDTVNRVKDFAGPGVHAVTGEWQMFITALEMGAARMNGDLRVIEEGEDEVTRQLVVEDHEH